MWYGDDEDESEMTLEEFELFHPSSSKKEENDDCGVYFDSETDFEF